MGNSQGSSQTKALIEATIRKASSDPVQYQQAVASFSALKSKKDSVSIRAAIDALKNTIKSPRFSNREKVVALQLFRDLLKDGHRETFEIAQKRTMKRLFAIASAPQKEAILVSMNRGSNLQDSGEFYQLLLECFQNWSTMPNASPQLKEYTTQLRKMGRLPVEPRLYELVPGSVPPGNRFPIQGTDAVSLEEVPHFTNGGARLPDNNQNQMRMELPQQNYANLLPIGQQGFVPNTRQPEQRLQDTRLQEQNYQEINKPDQRYQDMRNPEPIFQETKQPDTIFQEMRQPEQRYQDTKQPEQRFQDTRQPEQKYQDTKQIEPRLQDMRQPEYQFDRMRQQEERLQTIMSPEQRFQNTISPEQGTQKNNQGEPRLQVGRKPELRFQPKGPEQRSQDSMNMDSRVQNQESSGIKRSPLRSQSLRPEGRSEVEDFPLPGFQDEVPQQTTSPIRPPYLGSENQILTPSSANPSQTRDFHRANSVQAISGRNIPPGTTPASTPSSSPQPRRPSPATRAEAEYFSNPSLGLGPSPPRPLTRGSSLPQTSGFEAPEGRRQQLLGENKRLQAQIEEFSASEVRLRSDEFSIRRAPFASETCSRAAMLLIAKANQVEKMREQREEIRKFLGQNSEIDSDEYGSFPKKLKTIKRERSNSYSGIDDTGSRFIDDMFNNISQALTLHKAR